MRYRPPAWDRYNRDGAIAIPADTSLVVVDGVGSGRRALMRLVDGVVWVHGDPEVTAHRDAARVAAGELTEPTYQQWMAEERPFVAHERAWERAFAIVCGTPTGPLEPDELSTGTTLGAQTHGHT